MRIISGQHKGRRIIAPKQLPVRPTTDRAKEALFNILNNRYYFDSLAILDLFSGTGNISYEFASRGSRSILAVDGHYACVGFIKSIANNLELPIDTLKSDVFKFLEIHKQGYDIIFADPPYDISDDAFAKLPELVFKNSLLNTDGLLIIEHAKQTDLSHLSQFSEAKNYGSSVFSFFEH